MLTEPQDKLARLAARLAIPERAPDTAFVARVEMEIEARALVERAVRERREQVAVDVFATAALLLAAKELGTIATPAAELLLPPLEGWGTAALIGALVMLLLAAFAAAREARA